MHKPVKRGKFPIAIYAAEVFLQVYNTNAELTRAVIHKLNRLKREHAHDEGDEFAGYALREGNTYFIFLSLEALDINTITHETDHIKEYIMGFHNLSDMETSANLNGYINQEVFRFLKKSKLEIKY